MPTELEKRHRHPTFLLPPGVNKVKLHVFYHELSYMSAAGLPGLVSVKYGVLLIF